MTISTTSPITTILAHSNTIVTSTRGVEKLAQLIENIAKIFKNKIAGMAVLAKNMASLGSTMQALSFISGIHYFANIKIHWIKNFTLFDNKNSYGLINVIQKAAFLVSGCLTTVCWLNSVGLIAMGSISATLGTVAIGCAIGGLALGVVIAVKNLAKENGKNTVIKNIFDIVTNSFDALGLTILGFVTKPYQIAFGIISGSMGMVSVVIHNTPK